MASSADPSPLVRVPQSFDDEFPGASRRATEAFLNVGVLAGTVRTLIDSTLAAEGLPSSAAFNVLSVLGGDPEPLRPSSIADRMLVTRATITGVLDSLESRGLVRRLVGSDDGRSRDVVLTPKGRAVVDRVVPRMHDLERDLMCTLSDHELDELLAMVARLQARLLSLAPNAPIGIR